MKHPIKSLSACWKQTTPATRRAVLAGSALCVLLAASLILISCASTPQGIRHEQTIYAAGTNTVATLQTLIPYLPAPVATPAEIVLGAISAGLGAWNLHQ